MIDLRSETAMARGSNRLCFVHPQDPSKCLKVQYSNEGTTSGAQEEREYRRLLAQQDMSDSPVARYYAPQLTTLGAANVRELIRDHDGGISSTVLSCLTETVYRQRPDRWESALAEFREWLIAHAILAVDMTPENICVQQQDDERFRLVLVDGLGHHDRSGWLERSRTLRLWKLKTHIKKRGLTSVRDWLAVVEHYRHRASGNAIGAGDGTAPVSVHAGSAHSSTS